MVHFHLHLVHLSSFYGTFSFTSGTFILFLWYIFIYIWYMYPLFMVHFHLHLVHLSLFMVHFHLHLVHFPLFSAARTRSLGSSVTIGIRKSEVGCGQRSRNTPYHGLSICPLAVFI